MALEATGHSVGFFPCVTLYPVACASAWAFGAKSEEEKPKRAFPSSGVVSENRSDILWDTSCIFLKELKADGMPTVPDMPGPYRLFFYSFDCHEPPHVHVRRERMMCKFWLTPVALSVNHGFAPRELNRIRALIVENLARILEAWHDHCGE